MIGPAIHRVRDVHHPENKGREHQLECDCGNDRWNGCPGMVNAVFALGGLTLVQRDLLLARLEAQP